MKKDEKGAKVKEEKSKTKISLDEEISKVVIKSIEQECLNRVFDKLCSLGKLKNYLLENEKSSDDDSPAKRYQRQIEKKAKEKKMKLSSNVGVQSKSNAPVVHKEKKFKEDENNKNQNQNNETQTQLDKKIGVKSIRKTLRRLCQDNYPKEEMELMIWVCICL